MRSVGYEFFVSLSLENGSKEWKIIFDAEKPIYKAHSLYFQFKPELLLRPTVHLFLSYK